ncbi:uncharacterized protein JCM6883_004551 [Sporobolomyces salmoneus]|uniref:uncharacterized protein n=1 Tax=Sporobolomyces salmoneus TaxID=183962 RepID=UPI00316E864B
MSNELVVPSTDSHTRSTAEERREQQQEQGEEEVPSLDQALLNLHDAAASAPNASSTSRSRSKRSPKKPVDLEYSSGGEGDDDDDDIDDDDEEFRISDIEVGMNEEDEEAERELERNWNRDEQSRRFDFENGFSREGDIIVGDPHDHHRSPEREAPPPLSSSRGRLEVSQQARPRPRPQAQAQRRPIPSTSTISQKPKRRYEPGRPRPIPKQRQRLMEIGAISVMGHQFGSSSLSMSGNGNGGGILIRGTEEVQRARSCEGCRQRKARCSSHQVCSGCATRNIPCVWRTGAPLYRNTPVAPRPRIAPYPLPRPPRSQSVISRSQSLSPTFQDEPPRQNTLEPSPHPEIVPSSTSTSTATPTSYLRFPSQTYSNLCTEHTRLTRLVEVLTRRWETREEELARREGRKRRRCVELGDIPVVRPEESTENGVGREERNGNGDGAEIERIEGANETENGQGETKEQAEENEQNGVEQVEQASRNEAKENQPEKQTRENPSSEGGGAESRNLATIVTTQSTPHPSSPSTTTTARRETTAWEDAAILLTLSQPRSVSHSPQEVIAPLPVVPTPAPNRADPIAPPPPSAKYAAIVEKPQLRAISSPVLPNPPARHSKQQKQVNDTGGPRSNRYFTPSFGLDQFSSQEPQQQTQTVNPASTLIPPPSKQRRNAAPRPKRPAQLPLVPLPGGKGGNGNNSRCKTFKGDDHSLLDPKEFPPGYGPVLPSNHYGKGADGKRLSAKLPPGHQTNDPLDNPFGLPVPPESFVQPNPPPGGGSNRASSAHPPAQPDKRPKNPSSSRQHIQPQFGHEVGIHPATIFRPTPSMRPEQPISINPRQFFQKPSSSTAPKKRPTPAPPSSISQRFKKPRNTPLDSTHVAPPPPVFYPLIPAPSLTTQERTKLMNDRALDKLRTTEKEYRQKRRKWHEKRYNQVVVEGKGIRRMLVPPPPPPTMSTMAPVASTSKNRKVDPVLGGYRPLNSAGVRRGKRGGYQNGGGLPPRSKKNQAQPKSLAVQAAETWATLNAVNEKQQQQQEQQQQLQRSKKESSNSKKGERDRLPRIVVPVEPYRSINSSKHGFLGSQDPMFGVGPLTAGTEQEDGIFGGTGVTNSFGTCRTSPRSGGGGGARRFSAWTQSMISPISSSTTSPSNTLASMLLPTPTSSTIPSLSSVFDPLPSFASSHTPPPPLLGDPSSTTTMNRLFLESPTNSSQALNGFDERFEPRFERDTYAIGGSQGSRDRERGGASGGQDRMDWDPFEPQIEPKRFVAAGGGAGGGSPAGLETVHEGREEEKGSGSEQGVDRRTRGESVDGEPVQTRETNGNGQGQGGVPREVMDAALAALEQVRDS